MWELGEQYAEEVGIDWQGMAMDGAMVKAPLGEKQPVLIQPTEARAE